MQKVAKLNENETRTKQNETKRNGMQRIEAYPFI